MVSFQVAMGRRALDDAGSHLSILMHAFARGFSPGLEPQN